MERRSFIRAVGQGSIVFLGLPNLGYTSDKKPIKATIQQITNGQEHHFFGYIGQSLTIPWNSKGNLILALGSAFHDHLPGSNEPADVSLVHLDKPEGKFFKVEKIDKSSGWNLQQGNMFYWNPENPASQFFSMTGIQKQRKSLQYFLTQNLVNEFRSTDLMTPLLVTAAYVRSENHFLQ